MFPGLSDKVLVLVLLQILLRATFSEQDVVYLQEETPTYCIDPVIHDIVNERATRCIEGRTIAEELLFLRNISATDYHHSHELLAYQYFVKDRNNLNRRNCSEAEFEFIPILPFSWRSGYPTSTSCTAGGYCPIGTVLGNPTCTTKDFIINLLKIINHIKTTRNQNMKEGIPKFTIASTFNLRTYMAFGLPSAIRSGPTHTAISSFVTSTAIGTY